MKNMPNLNKAKYIAIIGVIVEMAIFTGCMWQGKSISMEESAKLFERELGEKYGDNFEVLGIDEGDDGQNFAHRYYNALISPYYDQDKIFEGKMDDNGRNLTDNYGKILFGDSVEQVVDDILESVDGIEISNMEIEYLLIEKIYDDVSDYISDGNVIVRFGADIEAKSLKKAAQKAYKLVDSLQKNNLCYSIDLGYAGRDTHLVRYNVTDRIYDLDDIKRRLEE